MYLFAQQQPEMTVSGLTVLLALGGTLALWGAIYLQFVLGRPVLPYQPRRRVPWQGWDVLLIFLIYVVGIIASSTLIHFCFSSETATSDAPVAAAQTTTNHSLLQLLAEGSWIYFLVGCLAAVVIAPLAEEIFFRVLLQGWLEKVDRDSRRQWPILRRELPTAAIPIILSALIFAGPHFREAAPPQDAHYLIWLFAGDGMAKILALVVGIILIYWRTGATAADLGWSAEKFWADVKLGVISFFALIVPIFGILQVALYLVPKTIAPDPIPLFFFAIVLGILYCRTHRAVPSIVVHMALNSSSVLLILLTKSR